YNSLDAPIPLARYEEAQLIIAEVDGTMSPAALAQERKYEFFLEGRRFGDIRRLNLEYDPAPGLQYPVAAASPKGGTYADLPGKGIPMPEAERVNNPNIPNTGTWTGAAARRRRSKSLGTDVGRPAGDARAFPAGRAT